MFNGQDLTGWDGRPDGWMVRDGAIWSTGKGAQRNWLIRRDFEAADFELRLQFRFQDGNSGVQVRSQDIGDWQVRGYQVEVAEHEVMGLWHHSLMSPDDETENARKHLATAGQRVTIDEAGSKDVTQFAQPEELTKACRDGEWNDLTVIARGPRLIQMINGKVSSDLTDQQKDFAARKGLIALQDHGKGTIAGFRNIRIRSLEPSDLGDHDLVDQDSSAVNPKDSHEVGKADGAAKRPNVLLVVVDDLNWRLGCYGSKVAHSPHIDRLAEKSVRFDRAYCNYPVCSASRTSFLSGRYASTTGILGNGPDPREVLGKDYRFLPEYFHDHGYSTACFGKLTHTPEHIESIAWDFRRDPEWEPKPVFDGIVAKETRAWPESQHPDGIAARLAVEFLAKEHDRPFFLAAGFHRPHAPRAAPQHFWDMFKPESLPVPEMGEDAGKGIPAMAVPPKYEPNATADAIQSNLWSYHATAAFVDAQTGLLLDALDRQDLWKDTIVVFFSDHGVHLGDHGGFWGKQSLMEESLKVPLLIHAPGTVAHDSSQEVVELVDVFPTLTELCDLPSQEGVEGERLTPLLRNPHKGRSKKLVFGMVRRDGKGVPVGYTVRDREWAYTEWPDGSRQLYHHAQAPEELHNVANLQEYAQVQQRLAEYLGTHRSRYPIQVAPKQPNTKPAASKLDVVGGEVSRHVQGRSLMPAIRDPNVAVRTFVCSEIHHNESLDYMVCENRYKWFVEGGVESLYDLESDEFEQANLINSSEHEATVRKLRERLREFLMTQQVNHSVGYKPLAERVKNADE